MKTSTVPKRLLLFLLISFALLALLVFVRGAAYADDGDLDPTFGGDGTVTTQFLGGDDQIYDMVVQPDGKIVAVGTTVVSETTLHDFALARYLPNGDLDTTFDGDGEVVTHILGDVDVAYAVALQPDGKIIAAGTAREISSAHFFMAVVRYLPNGNRDGSFGGGDGIVLIELDVYAAANAVAIQPDGKIMLAGTRFGSTSYDFLLARLNTDGSLDNSFDGDGKLSYDFFGMEDQIRAMQLQADGRIVVAGNAQLSSTNYEFAVARFNPDGSFDTTFDSDGRTTTDFFGGDDGAYGLAIQTNGSIVVAGSVYYEPSSYNFGVARYLANGALDPGFGVGGIKAENIGGVDSALDVAIQYDGMIVLAGDATAGTEDFAIARFTPNGFLDPTFSGDGFLTTDFSNTDDLGRAIAIQPNGKIIVAGRTYRSQNNYDFGLARYIVGNSNPTPTSTPIPTSTPTLIPSLTPTSPPNATSTPTTPPNATPTPTSPPNATNTPGATPTTCAIQFPDVQPGSTFYEYVMNLACRGVVSGYPDGTFGPNNPVTRGQLSKIVSNAAGYNEDHTVQSFQDVPVGSTFHLFVERLADRSIISGYPCGGPGEPCIAPNNLSYFRPNANVTRGQTSKIVAIARGLPAPAPGQQTFEDVPESSTFWQWIESLANSNAISGYPCGNPEPCIPPTNRAYFRPASQVTRGQSAKIVSIAFFLLDRVRNK